MYFQVLIVAKSQNIIRNNGSHSNLRDWAQYNQAYELILEEGVHGDFNCHNYSRHHPYHMA